MSERKPCLKCGRNIDAYAKLCPYCNWDQQSTMAPSEVEAATTYQNEAYVPPDERNIWKKRIAMGAAGIMLLIASFGVGAWINSDGAPKVPTEQNAATATAEPGRPLPQADVTLVPVSSAEEAAEAPITSAPIPAPAQGVPTEYQRSDATAVSSEEYAQLAARARAEKKLQQSLVDPRTLTGRAYAGGTPAVPAARRPQQQAARPPQQQQQPNAVPPAGSTTVPMPEPMASQAREPEPELRTQPSRNMVVRTRPVPIAQPLPDIRVFRPVTARMELIVGPDGRVKEVTMKESIPGETFKLIRAVQNWRFKPATENGVPVSSTFSVDISFNQ